MFVVPGGAGDDEDLFAARRLARVTGGHAPFFALRSGAPPHPPADDLAARYVREIRSVAPGPYALVGDCMGGILAFAIARRLRELSVYSEILPFSTPLETLRARRPAGMGQRLGQA